MDLNREIERLRSRLHTYVSLRLNDQVRRRIDASDIVQEACLEAARRLDYYRQLKEVPFYIWLRGLARDHLVEAQRRHLQAQARDARREKPSAPEVSSVALADVLVAGTPTPSKTVMAAEERGLLERALEDLGQGDREIIAMRHFEELSNAEVARALGLTDAAASARYVRAIRKVRSVLRRIEGPPSGD